MQEAVQAAARQLCDALNRLVEDCDDLAADEVYEQITSAQDSCLSQLAATGIWGKANQMPSNDFWKIAGPVVSRGPLQWHARQKPHGYAGDYEMLDRIAAWQTSDGKLEGAFDRYFQNQSAPNAVRNRTRIIAGAIVDAVHQRATENTHVLSVGAGPAAEVRRAASQLDVSERQHLRAHLLDLDPNALQFARDRLIQLLPADNIHCHRVNLFRLPSTDLGQLVERTDLAVCSGLLDYLQPKDATAMLHLLWRHLASDGQLLAFNFSNHNPSRAYMEWFGNWYLIYRNRDEICDIATAAGIPSDHFVVDAESEGVNLFVRAKK